MNLDERMEELASLYVLGALEGPELREFEAALRSRPELREFVAQMGKSVEAVAGAVPVIEPPPQLRAKILAQIEPAQKRVALPERPFAAALWWLRMFSAGLAVVILVLFARERGFHQTIAFQQQNLATKQLEISNLQTLAQSLRSATNDLTVSLLALSESNRQTVVALEQENHSLHLLAQTLQSATNDLYQTVLALNESNRLANLRIAMLNSLAADAPKTVAVTLWDSRIQGGVFVVENLKEIPADRDYELWVMDEHKVPVAAGVFHMDASGTTRMEFKPVRSIQQAGQFCVTEEVKGGVDSPTLKNLILASN